MGCLYKRKQKLGDGTVRELPTWWIKYYQHGRAIRESTGTTKETVARRMLRAREGDVEHGIPIAPKVGRVTFEDAAKDLLNDYKTNGRTTHDEAKRRIDKHLVKAVVDGKKLFAGRLMANITTSDVRAFVAARLANRCTTCDWTAKTDEDAKRTECPDCGKAIERGAAPAEVNRELSALKRMFTLCVQAAKLHSKPHIPMLREDNVRRGFFERDQFEAMRAALPAELRPVVSFAYQTGWRVYSEILTLEWRHVDFDGRTVRLDPGTTKNREGRTFPFTLELEQLLKAQLAEHELYKKADPPKVVARVFHRGGEPIKDFRGAFNAACRAAGCPGRILHDFRRTAVRNLERAGVSRSAAMAMVGHKTEAIYRRYAIVDAGAMRDAAAKLDRAAGTISGTTTQSSEKSEQKQTA